MRKLNDYGISLIQSRTWILQHTTYTLQHTLTYAHTQHNSTTYFCSKLRTETKRIGFVWKQAGLYAV